MGDKVRASWQGEMQFSVESKEGVINLDASEEFGGSNNGLQPKSLMLSSLAGCTGMDLGSIVKNMKLNVDEIAIDVSAELTEEHPRIYRDTHMQYTFTGANLDEKELRKAVDLSIDKYCGVLAMFKAFSEVTFDVVFKHESVVVA